MLNFKGSGLFREAIKLFIVFAFLASGQVDGHEKNETYIWLNPQKDHFNGHVEFRLDDLRKFFGMDIPDDFAGAQKKVVELGDELKAYVNKHFELKQVTGDPIPYKIVKVDLLENDYFGHFAQLFFETDKMEVPAQVVVKTDFLFEHDKYSRCLLCTQYNEFTGKSFPENFYHAVYSPWNDEQEIDFTELNPVKRGRRYYVWEGIRHIWIGLDHILFLVTLLLASVLVKRRVDGGSSGNAINADESLVKDTEEKLDGAKFKWIPVEGFTGAFWSIFKIVTVFTIAHSITLALASLDIITLPSQLVESIIALSIVLVAINNIIPTFRDRTWIILFLFGLFHGMGFASVMKNLPFRMSNLNQLLLCFNLGVEIGQMAIVAAVFPVIFALRKTSFYKPVVLVGGSMVMIAIAGYWFVERAMGWG